MKDKLGRELLPGDRIAYATRYASSLELTIAVVVGKSSNPNKVRVRPEGYCRFTGMQHKVVTLGTPEYVIKLYEQELPRCEQG
jgi:hypothetical protein